MGYVSEYGVWYMATFCVFFGGFKGLGGSGIRQWVLPLFQSGRMATLGEYQRLVVLSMVPFGMKPAFGLMSSTFPIGGYSKRWYIRIGSTFSCVSGVMLAVWGVGMSTWLATTTVFLFVIGYVLCDVMFEGSYAEKVGENAVANLKLMNLAWGLTLGFGMVASVWVGMFSGASVSVGSYVPVGGVVVFWVFGMVKPIQEKGRTVREGMWQLKTKLGGAGKVVVALGVCVVLSTHLIYVESALMRVVGVGVLGMGVMVSNYAFLEREIAGPNGFMFVYEVGWISLQGGSEYFYTGGCAGTPHFGYDFYVTWMSVVGGIFGVLGVKLFNDYGGRIGMRQMFVWLGFGRVLLAVFEVMQYERLNVAMGIPDEVFFLVSEGVIGQIFSTFGFMALVGMASALCPSDVEIVYYAMIAGFQNYGQTLAGILGTALLDVGGVYHTTSSDCGYVMMGVVSVIGHMVIPLITIPMGMLMLPTKSIVQMGKKEGVVI
jgi:hypothetical protein